jgi:anti-anti-sigma regulatory factor
MNFVNTLQLLTSSPNGLRAQAIAAADETIRLGQTQLIIDLDNLTHADDAVLSALILALRRLREAGASLRVLTSKDPIRNYLDSTGMRLAFGLSANADDTILDLSPRKVPIRERKRASSEHRGDRRSMRC